MTAESSIRVTHREREDAVEGLRAAYALGCLDDSELEERTSLAYAGKTRGDLAGLVSDLPPVPATGAVSGGRAARRRDWPGCARRSLCLGCGLLLTATGAWLIAITAAGITAVPLIFLWFIALRLCGRLFPR